MLARLSSRELTEWAAYDKVEPFGEQRADIRTAIIAYLLACANFKGSHKIEDFLAVKPYKPPQNWQAMKVILGSTVEERDIIK